MRDAGTLHPGRAAPLGTLERGLGEAWTPDGRRLQWPSPTTDAFQLHYRRSYGADSGSGNRTPCPGTSHLSRKLLEDSRRASRSQRSGRSIDKRGAPRTVQDAENLAAQDRHGRGGGKLNEQKISARRAAVRRYQRLQDRLRRTSRRVLLTISAGATMACFTWRRRRSLHVPAAHPNGSLKHWGFEPCRPRRAFAGAISTYRRGRFVQIARSSRRMPSTCSKAASISGSARAGMARQHPQVNGTPTAGTIRRIARHRPMRGAGTNHPHRARALRPAAASSTVAFDGAGRITVMGRHKRHRLKAIEVKDGSAPSPGLGQACARWITGHATLARDTTAS